MLVIGISGPKFSGKDTLARLIIEEGCDSRPIRTFAFAYALKAGCRVVFELSHEQVHGAVEVKEATDPRWDKSPRELMQLFGTEVGRAIDQNVWVKSVGAQVKKWVESLPVADQDTALAIITDTRFINEAKWVKDRGGVVVKVYRDSSYTGFREDHASETEMWEIREDIAVHNNGTLEDLRSHAREVLASLEELRG